jgi:hypothetical protein
VRPKVFISDTKQIKETSAFALSLSSLLRDIILVCGSSVVFGNTLGVWQIAGYGLVVCCLVDYSWTSRRAAVVDVDEEKSQPVLYNEKE